MMTIYDAKVGDWFVINEVVFCKTEDNTIVALSANYVDLEDDFEPNWSDSIRFCSEFGVNEDCSNPLEQNKNREPDMYLENEYYKIPVGAIYKGLGETYYVKDSEESCVVFWSKNPRTMGKHYSKDRNAKGTFNVVCYKYFTFPEIEGELVPVIPSVEKHAERPEEVPF